MLETRGRKSLCFGVNKALLLEDGLCWMDEYPIVNEYYKSIIWVTCKDNWLQELYQSGDWESKEETLEDKDTW